jgi:acyl-CoA dehydrogenase
MDFDLSKEQKDIVKAAREFAQGEFPDRAEAFDQEESFDEMLHKKAAELGFVGVFIDEAYEGPGMGMLESCLIAEEFTAVDPGIAMAILSSCFGAEVVQAFGSEEQKKTYLPPLVLGEAVMGIALTEAEAGSDLGTVSTFAARQGDDYVINGSKVLITNGSRANSLLCLAVADPENGDVNRRHSMIMVETHRDGFESRPIKGKLGARACDTAEVSFRNVSVPYSNLIGEPGRGLEAAAHHRLCNGLFAAAQAVGIARAGLEESMKHAKKRMVFNAPLSSFQAIQFFMADMYIWIQAGRNLVCEAAWRLDQGRPDEKLTGAAKCFCSQTAVQCADTALQVHGGYGYLADYKVQRLYRDAKVMEVYAGTAEMDKMIIARNLLG